MNNNTIAYQTEEKKRTRMGLFTMLMVCISSLWWLLQLSYRIFIMVLCVGMGSWALLCSFSSSWVVGLSESCRHWRKNRHLVPWMYFICNNVRTFSVPFFSLLFSLFKIATSLCNILLESYSIVWLECCYFVFEVVLKFKCCSLSLNLI